MRYKKIKVETVIGIVIMVIFTGIMTTDFVNTIQHSLIGYDEGYNATVAANVARYGEYRVSYPSNIVFYNKITTGTSVIIPTAIFYKIFGINYISTTIISVLYSICATFGIWILMSLCLGNIKGKSIFSAIGTIILILSDDLYYYISTHLIGEIAAFFFLICGMICTYFYFYYKKKFILFITGIFFTAAFLTKSSMIFFLVSVSGIFFIEVLITKRIHYKGLVSYLIGIVAGFILFDSYKFAQLGGMSGYILYWKNEWENMLNQSSGIDTAYSIADKFKYLEEIFGGCNRYICAIMVLAPIMIYFIHMIKLKEKCDMGLLTMTIGAVGGASLIVYFVLLGGSGLVYARRHEVNEIFIRMFALFSIIYIIYFIKNNFNEINDGIFEIVIIFLLIVSAFNSIAPINNIISNYYEYRNKLDDDEYAVTLMKEFLNEITDLPEGSKLYTAGWWQEPDVTLFLDKKMNSIYEVSENEDFENAFFIVGNYIHDLSIEDVENILGADLIRVDYSENDYALLDTAFNRNNIERYAIYKIVKR